MAISRFVQGLKKLNQDEPVIRCDVAQHKMAHAATVKASFILQGTVVTASRPSDSDTVRGTAGHNAKSGERANISNATLERLTHGAVICKTLTNCTLNINFNKTCRAREVCDQTNQNKPAAAFGFCSIIFACDRHVYCYCLFIDLISVFKYTIPSCWIVGLYQRKGNNLDKILRTAIL